MKRTLLIPLIVFLAACANLPGSDPVDKPAKAYRYVIITDMTHDDDNSLIRLLHYANEVDIEAIAVTDQGPETTIISNWKEKMWASVQEIYDHYEIYEDKLRLHDPDFPTAEYFRSITKKGLGTAERMSGSSDDGNEQFWDYVGEGRDSEASDFLQEVFARDDERPIYVGLWGGPLTFAQAMWRFRQNHTDQEMQDLLDKMILYNISLQDVTLDLFMDVDNIGDDRFYGNYEGERLIPSMNLVDLGHFWDYLGVVNQWRVLELGGSLGDLYDRGGEGDTPAFLNLLSMNLGLSSIKHPEFGGWGNMFLKHPLPNVWSAQLGDKNELRRWIEAANNSFYARLLWQENGPEDTNHDPRAAFRGDTSPDFVYLRAAPGDKVKLDAAGSYDPDGDSLSYSWWQYGEVDSYEGKVTIHNHGQKQASLVIPADAANRNIHIILEVTDDGAINLTSYKRIIITVI